MKLSEMLDAAKQEAVPTKDAAALYKEYRNRLYEDVTVSSNGETISGVLLLVDEQGISIETTDGQIRDIRYEDIDKDMLNEEDIPQDNIKSSDGCLWFILIELLVLGAIVFFGMFISSRSKPEAHDIYPRYHVEKEIDDCIWGFHVGDYYTPGILAESKVDCEELISLQIDKDYTLFGAVFEEARIDVDVRDGKLQISSIECEIMDTTSCDSLGRIITRNIAQKYGYPEIDKDLSFFRIFSTTDTSRLVLRYSKHPHICVGFEYYNFHRTVAPETTNTK